jgi:8-oxo-dGTP diphosphatase
MSSAGRWECPGGKVEAGETDGAALARELHEELTVTVTVAEHLMDVVVPHNQGTLRLVFYVCALPTGEPVLTEHDAVRWCTADDLLTLKWQTADEPAVESIRRLLSED